MNNPFSLSCQTSSSFKSNDLFEVITFLKTWRKWVSYFHETTHLPTSKWCDLAMVSR